MEENFLLKEVINELVDAKTSLVTPLMKLQYFASLTENTPLLEFVDKELNGYSADSDVPEYRVSGAFLKADLQIGFETYPNREIPIEMLEERQRATLRKFKLFDPVAVLERKIANNGNAESRSQLLSFEFPLTFLDSVQNAAEKLYKNEYYKTEVVGARLLANADIIPKALTAIRSKLLTFVMKVAKSFGYDIGINSFNSSQSINNEKINFIMNTVINNQGDGNVINSGAGANIKATITVTKGNKEALNKNFQELGIDPTDIDEVNRIVDEETESFETKKLGNKAIDWITNVSGKALKGVGSIAKDVTSSLLANLLKQYYGIPD